MAVVINYSTESGDRGCLGVFNRAPNGWEEERKIIEHFLPHEVEVDEALGSHYYYANLIVEKVDDEVFDLDTL